MPYIKCLVGGKVNSLHPRAREGEGIGKRR